MHPEPERLQGYADLSLPEGDRSVVESHLQTCGRCASQVEEWRALFLVLSGLPHLAPRPGFADRVMAAVHLPVRVPVYAPLLKRAGELMAQAAPRTTGGWALLTAFVTLPLLLVSGAVAWLFSRGYLTPATLWAFINEQAATGVQSLGASVLATVMQTRTVGWLADAVRQVVGTTGVSGLGVIMAASALLTSLSIWILYRYLFRTPTRESNHVTYSF
jgi:anti-sigma factor RsiW